MKKTQRAIVMASLRSASKTKKKATKEDIIDTISVSMSNASRNEYSRSQQMADITVKNNNTLEEVFPWLPEFNKIIYSTIRDKNYQNLERLIVLYTQNILSSVTASNVNFAGRVNMMSHVTNMLIFYHLYWLDIKQDVADHNSYLCKMSALLNVYINMELKLSMEKSFSSDVINSSKIAAKILTALYMYLNNSEEHIFRVLLRIKHTTTNTEICNHIFMKSFENTIVRKSVTTPITDVAYVRYLFTIKIWKKMDKISDKQINNMAISLLGPRMPKLRNELLEFVPRPPTNEENETLWLLQSDLLDLKQAHEQFLLFEDKMDSFVDLQCNKIIQTGQKCSKPQKHQMNSLYHRNISSGNKTNHEANKDHVGNSQNYTVATSTNKNKFPDQCLQKKGTRNFQSLKKNRVKPEKHIIIDLTGDDELITPCIVKRKKITRNLECVKSSKSKQKFQKHISRLKYFSRVDGQKTGDNLKKNNGSSIDKIHLNSKLASDSICDNIDNDILISSKPLLNDIYQINPQKNEHFNMTKSQTTNIRSEFGKEDEKQHDYNSHYVNTSMIADHDIKEFKIPRNVSKVSKPETRVSLHVTYMTENTSNSYNPNMQNKQAFISQEENAMETIPSFKMCQDSVIEQPAFKQEVPTNINSNVMQKSHKCCETLPADKHDIKQLIKELKSINEHNSQITKIINQKECHQVNECPNHCAKIDCKPIVFINNDVTATKSQDALHNTLENDNDPKLACDTNIIYMLTDQYIYKCVVNHIGEGVMTVHAEKRVQCLDKSNDTCIIPTALAEDQIVDSALYNQHVNFNNITVSDYTNAAKHFEIAMKEQQPLLYSYTVQYGEVPQNSFKLYKMKYGRHSNSKMDNDLKRFPKVEETDEIMKTDYVDNMENYTHFLNNIQNETVEDFLPQFSMHQINYDNSTGIPIKKPLVYPDNDANAVKAQNTVHSSESCIFDINFFLMDSKETNEIITDYINLENIEDVSNDTIDFIYNNQNDVIDSINSMAFCLNTD